MYTPTYQKITVDNQAAKNAAYFTLNVDGPNASRAIQLVPTAGTGTVQYTIYSTAFPAQGKISDQPYEFDILNMKYWTILGTANSSTGQYIEFPHSSTAVWVITTITGNATLEYSVVMPGIQ